MRPRILHESARRSPASLPVVLASPELGLSYAILNRHLFMNRQDLRLPTTLLLDAAGSVVKAYRDGVDVSLIVRDVAAIEAAPAERLARAVPFPGHVLLAAGRSATTCRTGGSCSIRGSRPLRSSPSSVPRRRARAPRRLYRLGTLLAKSGEAGRARAAFERALAMQPDLAEASNDLGALLAQGGELEAAIERFRAALASTPEYPDALNNLGYALLLSGRDDEARALYEKALALQPDFPEALNNLGLLFGRAGDLDRAERYFRDALAPARRLRRGGQQPGARPRGPRPGGCGRPPARGIPRERPRSSRAPT